MTAMQINNDPQFWSDLRAKMLDRSKWNKLRKTLGLSQVDGKEMSPSRTCTGVMPELDTPEKQYIVAGMGADFWQWNMAVSLAWVASGRAKEWCGIPYGKLHGDDDSFLLSDLSDAILIDAILVGAILVGADLRGANLRGAILVGADLRGARYNASTRFPEGFSPSERGMVEVKG